MSDSIPAASGGVTLNRVQSRLVDTVAIEQFGIPGVVLMENAGRGCADWIKQHHASHHILIFCGKGNNGGDGAVIARYLSIYNIACTIVLTTPIDKLSGDAAVHMQIAQHMGIPIKVLDHDLSWKNLENLITHSQVLVDALLGTGIAMSVREPYKKLIELINNAHKTVISIDLPSGMDVDTGKPLGECVQAAHTLTLVSNKEGFRFEESHKWTGECHIIPIGIPPKIIQDIRSMS